MKLKGKKPLIFTALVALALILLGALYARYITDLLTSESRMHLSEVATQGAASVQRQVARDFDMLEILADGIISNPDVPFEDKMERIKQQADKFGLFRIAIVDLEGNARASDGFNFSVADREFFKTAVKGERCVSEPIIDKVDKMTRGIVYAVPVYHEGKVVSVLFSGYELSKLTERIDISFYHESGLAFVVDSDGNVLLHPVEERIGKNIADVAASRNKPAKVEQLKSDLKNGKSGVAHFTMSVDERFFAYAPIKGANDWFLFTSLPAEAVFERSQKVILLTSLLLTLICLLILSAALYIAVTKKKANAQIVKLAYYDQLTGAKNAERFKLDAGALLRKYGAQKYNLLNFDVKQFRYLNNDLGYKAGNEFLLHIVDCLKSVSMKGEAFARVGTDQFLFLFFKRDNDYETEQVIKRLRNEISAWKQPTGGYYSVQLALGVYKIQARDTDIMSAIEKSNIARRTAKNNFDLGVAVYDEAMQSSIDRDTELEKSMPAALENGEFKLFIQPKYDLLTEKIVGGEALVRWIKPDGSVIYPGAFIPLFEQNGAICPMDMYMLKQLCDFVRSQMDRGVPTVPISINQSRRYMYDPDYVEIICDKLRQSSVPSRMIELEITENLVYTDLDKLILVLDALHREGFRISLDDFGSGYSSLNVLKELDVDTLKLDRSMLSENLNSPRERAVFTNVISMAKEMKMSVVAEGVETLEQVTFLRECGCEMAQGYYFSKPVTAEQFEELLLRDQNQ
ncbi:MAG: GGDEF domain-containing protein [Oscillospiraceae bacterium]